MDKLKGFIARVLPLTRKGWVFLLLSAALLALGLLRSELAVLLWGAAFGVLSLYGLVATRLLGGLVSRRIRRRVEEVSAVVEPSRVAAGGRASVRVSTHLPRRRPPGVRLYAEARLEWNGRHLRASAYVPPGSTGVRIAVPTDRRGVWEPQSVRVTARDFLGFCADATAVPTAGTLRVLPKLRELPVATPVGASGGEGRVASSLRYRTEELFETRRYVPGDDPRKINWKLFARWNELLVRIGEEVPPPQSRVRCYLYTGSPERRQGRQSRRRRSVSGRQASRRQVPRRPGSRRQVPRRPGPHPDATLEAVVSGFGGVCRALARKGVSVVYGYGGTEARGSMSVANEVDFLSELAGVDWDYGDLPEPAGADTSASSRLPVVVVAPAGRTGLDAVLAHFRRGGRAVESISVPVAHTDGRAPVSILQRLFFRTEAPKRAEEQGV